MGTRTRDLSSCSIRIECPNEDDVDIDDDHEVYKLLGGTRISCEINEIYEVTLSFGSNTCNMINVGEFKFYKYDSTNPIPLILTLNTVTLEQDTLLAIYLTKLFQKISI